MVIAGKELEADKDKETTKTEEGKNSWLNDMGAPNILIPLTKTKFIVATTAEAGLKYMAIE